MSCLEEKIAKEIMKANIKVTKVNIKVILVICSILLLAEPEIFWVTVQYGSTGSNLVQ